MRRILGMISAAIAGLVSACDNGPQVTAPSVRSAVTWSSMTYASKDGPIRVEVHGNPFSLSQDRFADLVASAMSNAVHGRIVHFTSETQKAPQPQFRVVAVFDPAPSLDPRSVCAGEPVLRLADTAPNSDRRIGLLMIFCHKGDVLSSLTGWVAKITGPEDPRFAQLLSIATRELFGTGF